jgi:hypothetical protein
MFGHSDITSSQNRTFELGRRETGKAGFFSWVAEDEVVDAVDAQVSGLVLRTVGRCHFGTQNSGEEDFVEFDLFG